MLIRRLPLIVGLQHNQVVEIYERVKKGEENLVFRSGNEKIFASGMLF